MLKKILKLITHRVFIVGLLLVIQLVILIGVVSEFERYGLLFYVLFFIIGILSLLKIITSKANPSYKIAWIIPVLTIPIFGTLFYILFGNKPKVIKSKYKLIQDKDILNKIKDEDLNYYNQANYLVNNNYPVYDDTYTEYLEIGETYYKRLIEELKKAKKYIFIQYFIIHEGKFWNSILEVLKEKVKEGVDVRVIYDDFGCIVTLPNKYYNELNKYGIKACSFNKFIPVLTAKLNNRDHRKITVIDGIVGITGGINIADEYINAIEKYGHWKDNGILIKGKATWSLTTIFLKLWDSINDIDEDFNKFRPTYEKTNNIGYVQPYDDNPFDNELIGETVYLNLINKAKKYIYITTPYLIIDNELETALCNASKSGIDVRIITPGIYDKKLVNEVTKAYYNNLLENGIKIYEYNGFIHAKTFLVDDELATVGTINLDYRSLYLHFEDAILMYKTESINQIKKDFDHLFEICKKITLNDTKISFLRSLKRAILILFAPLM